MANKVSE